MYLEALKKGYRYPTPKGFLSTEKLTQLDFSELEATGTTLQAQIDELGGSNDLFRRSRNTSPKKAMLETKLAIVLDIYNNRDAEVTKASKASEIKAKRQKLIDLKANKEAEDMKNLSVADLDVEIAKLDEKLK